MIDRIFDVSEMSRQSLDFEPVEIAYMGGERRQIFRADALAVGTGFDFDMDG